MAAEYSDDQIASTLNRKILGTGPGSGWTAKTVAQFRAKHKLSGYCVADSGAPSLTLEALEIRPRGNSIVLESFQELRQACGPGSAKIDVIPPLNIDVDVLVCEVVELQSDYEAVCPELLLNAKGAVQLVQRAWFFVRGVGQDEDELLFRLTPPTNPDGSWTETILHTFTGKSRDGAVPLAGLSIV